MSASVPTIVVAAGVVIERGRVLLTQRKAGAHLGGVWELPGGKVDPGEDPRDALHPGFVHRASLGACGDVVEDEFVGALVTIAAGKIENAADDAMIAKAHALDDLSIADV